MVGTRCWLDPSDYTVVIYDEELGRTLSAVYWDMDEAAKAAIDHWERIWPCTPGYSMAEATSAMPCAVLDCPGTLVARGLCRKHYDASRKRAA